MVTIQLTNFGFNKDSATFTSMIDLNAVIMKTKNSTLTIYILASTICVLFFGIAFLFSGDFDYFNLSKQSTIGVLETSLGNIKITSFSGTTDSDGIRISLDNETVYTAVIGYPFVISSVSVTEKDSFVIILSSSSNDGYNGLHNADTICYSKRMHEQPPY